MSTPHLQSDERFIRKVRRHWVVLVAQLAPYLLFAVFPLFLVALFPSYDLAIYGPWIQLLLGIYWLFIWSCVLTIFSIYYLTHWIVTSHRIIHTHQRGLLSRKHWSVYWHEATDRRIEQHTALDSLFGTGTLIIMVPGSSEPFKMDGIELSLLHSIHERTSFD